MNKRLGVRFAFSSLFLLVSGGAAFAQDHPARHAAALGGVLMIMLLMFLAVYIYMALALQTIAQKTNTDNAWLAWIPIANIVLLLNIAGKPVWWIILFLIPIVNIVIGVLAWMGVAEARQKPNWWGILMIIPFVNLIVPGYLAWAD